MIDLAEERMKRHGKAHESRKSPARVCDTGAKVLPFHEPETEPPAEIRTLQALNARTRAMSLPSGYSCGVAHAFLERPPAWIVTVTAPPGGGFAWRSIPEGTGNEAVLRRAVSECLAELGIAWTAENA